MPDFSKAKRYDVKKYWGWHNGAMASILKHLRKQRKVSQAALAKRAGVHANVIYRIEAGIVNPTMEVFVCIANGLELEGWELLKYITDYEERAALPVTKTVVQTQREFRAKKKARKAKPVGKVVHDGGFTITVS